MKKLEESLQLLQKNEERLRFWGVERTDDPNLAGDMLQEFGLWLDRRREFPRKIADFSVAAGTRRSGIHAGAGSPYPGGLGLAGARSSRPGRRLSFEHPSNLEKFNGLLRDYFSRIITSPCATITSFNDSLYL